MELSMVCQLWVGCQQLACFPMEVQVMAPLALCQLSRTLLTANRLTPSLIG